ncbi:MAG: hypothetical protein L0Y78_10335 [candidate division NC10 bacterium]|nr:hypothetical protein [candidate division NC10 bacterium]
MIETQEIPKAIVLVAKGFPFRVSREGKWVTFCFPTATEDDIQSYYTNEPLPCRSVIEAQRTVRIALSPR